MRKQRLLLAALVLLMSVPAFAQKFTASIRGTVTDTSNAVVAGAKVTLKNEETGLTRTQTTNTAGNYSFPDIPVGSYRVEVELPGFKSAVRTQDRHQRRRRPRRGRPALDRRDHARRSASRPARPA